MTPGLDNTILRVFPRRTNATPDDALVRIGYPDMFDPPDCDEVHVSVTFTWDIATAKCIFAAWSRVHPCVRIGGPAFGDPGGEFVPCRYLAPGHVITSRGCPNHCKMCLVPEREGSLRELPIESGHKIHDNNLLACSSEHVLAVAQMLMRQSQRGILVGGLEAARFTPWHAELFRDCRIDRMFFAYDRPSGLLPLQHACAIARDAGFTSTHHLFAYVLIGCPGDTLEAAETRLRETWDAGAMPYAMLYRATDWTEEAPGWRTFQRRWARPALTRTLLKTGAAP